MRRAEFSRCIAFACLAIVALAPPAAGHAAMRLAGPDGVSNRKVLVIGLDGVRWDVLQQVIALGGAPHLGRLGSRGIAKPTFLPYTLPEAATISEVGWTTIAAGVGPRKHGVNGIFLNNDPRQRTKNGYLDFLSRAERVRPKLSTFLASDWSNIGLAEHGGPIFGEPLDARYAVSTQDTIAAYERGDEQVAGVAARYLRRGDPDAGFVYFGLVDEVAHVLGSATPAYADAIATTDRRVGRLLDAIRSRSRTERWTIIVTTDHGQSPLTYGSLLSHGLNSDLERTSFVIAEGPGIGRGTRARVPGVVDIAPTVLRRLGIRIDPAWRLDGRPFGR